MSEQQQYEGERWTTQTINILKELGWTQIGSSNFDIPCLNKAFHRRGKSEERRNDHGVDSVFTYYDPSLNEDINVIVESKKRIWSGITKSNIESFIDQLLMTTECADLSVKMKELGCEGFNTGLLMIWCNELENYNHEKIQDILNQIELAQRRKPITLYIATNYEILKWSSLIEYKRELLSENEEFDFFYPSDFYRRGKSISNQKKHITLIPLFSSYIFAKSKMKIDNYGEEKVIDTNHIFYFAEPTKKELEFMYQLIKDFQFEAAHLLIFHFYGEQTKYREYISDFIRNKRAILKENQSHLKIEVRYMNELKNVPEKYNKREEI